jgi:hypothetical protein
MNGNGKDGPLADWLAARSHRLGARARGPRIKFSAAVDKLAAAFLLQSDAARMVLYGLCATGGVRWFDRSGKIAEEDELTVTNFGGKPGFIVAEDLQHCIAEWSHEAPLLDREKVIKQLFAEGNTPSKLTVPVFCERVREACKGHKLRGFGDRQTMRLVRGLRKK